MVIQESKLRKLAKTLSKIADERRLEAKKIHEGPSMYADRDHKVIAFQNQADAFQIASMKLLELLHEEHKEKRWPTLARRK